MFPKFSEAFEDNFERSYTIHLHTLKEVVSQD